MRISFAPLTIVAIVVSVTPTTNHTIVDEHKDKCKTPFQEVLKAIKSSLAKRKRKDKFSKLVVNLKPMYSHRRVTL